MNKYMVLLEGIQTEKGWTGDLSMGIYSGNSEKDALTHFEKEYSNIDDIRDEYGECVYELYENGIIYLEKICDEKE